MRAEGKRRGGAIVLTAAVAAALAIGGAIPAQAAAVAGVATPDGKPAASTQSRVIVSWDGTTETIELELGLDAANGTVGLILPTPSKATVSPGDPALFRAAENVIAPVEHREDDWWGRSTVAEPTVAPVAEAPLGTIAPVSVAGTNRSALSKWLKKNGLKLSQADRSQLTEYGSDGWALTLVSLDAATARNGELAPLQLRFATKRPVLPMRLAGSTKTATSVRVYALGDHRSALRILGTSRNPNAAQSVVWAGPATAALSSLGAYLTVTDVRFDTPRTQVTGDLGLIDAPADATLIPSTVVYSPIRLLGFPLGWLLVVWGGIGALLAVGYVVNRFRSQ